MDVLVQVKRLVIARRVLFTQKAEGESEPMPCPECGAMQMTQTVGNCRLSDGIVVRRLRHFRCGECGSTFFEDAAMHRIQAERAKHAVAQAV